MARDSNAVPAGSSAAVKTAPEEPDLALETWAERLAHESRPEVPDHQHRPPDRRPPRDAALKIVIGCCVFAASLVLGISIFLFQLRPDILGQRATVMLLEAVLAFIVVLLLALTLFRLMVLGAARPVQTAAPSLFAAAEGCASQFAGVARMIAEIDEQSAALEARLAAIANGVDWSARKNLATLQSVAAALEAERTRMEDAGAASEATLKRVAETARILTALVAEAGDSVWGAASEADLTLEAKTRYMAERLRQDLRGVVDEALADFEYRARTRDVALR